MKTLRVHLPEEGRDTLRMSWSAGLATVVYAHPEVREDVDRWLRRGLIEFVRDADGGLTQRITQSHEPLFLERIAASLQRQFSYAVEVKRDSVQRTTKRGMAIVNHMLGGVLVMRQRVKAALYTQSERHSGA